MQKNQIRIGLATLVFSLGITLTSYAEWKKGEELSLAQLPAAAQKTVNQQTAGGKIGSISKEIEHGQTEYEVKFVKADKKLEIAVAPDGKLLGTEEEVDLTKVPEAVQMTIKEQAADGTINRIATVNEDGKVLYEAVVMGKDKKPKWFQVAVDGKLMPKEADEEENDHKNAKEHKGEDKD